MYTTIEQQYLSDAKKYVKSAIDYNNKEMLNRSLGCLIKAIRKLEKYREYKKFQDVDPILNDMINLMVKQIGDTILNSV